MNHADMARVNSQFARHPSPMSLGVCHQPVSKSDKPLLATDVPANEPIVRSSVDLLRFLGRRVQPHNNGYRSAGNRTALRNPPSWETRRDPTGVRGQFFSPRD